MNVALIRVERRVKSADCFSEDTGAVHERAANQIASDGDLCAERDVDASGVVDFVGTRRSSADLRCRQTRYERIANIEVRGRIALCDRSEQQQFRLRAAGTEELVFLAGGHANVHAS